MHYGKFKLSNRIQLFLKLLPDCHLYCYNRYSSKMFNHAIKVNPINEYNHQNVVAKTGTEVVDKNSILAEKLRDCKTQMTNCMDPIKKYEYLSNMRDNNIELYYHYACNNTVEVFSVFHAVDLIIDNFYLMGQVIFNQIIKKLEISSDVDHLRNRVNDHKEPEFQIAAECASNSKNIKIIPLLKDVSPIPNSKYHYMIYLQTK
ncbi:uncharacterized protein LOC116805068 [Drosophila grimshawi]|uniref:uncharacterized protein LOC116805068 n=1 Tax=Drosophila grimshawi TaxID=7222 RepID=UPI000C86F41B|nr:uncharacterized protein LOC116805068 [Drosophila grimshawi]